MNTVETSSSQDESRAIAILASKGREYVQARFNELASEARYRWESVQPLPPDCAYTPLDFLSEEERGERHILLLAQMLCIDEKAEAQARIALRLAKRRKGVKQQ